MKRKWMWVPIIAIALCAIGFSAWAGSKAGVISHVRRNLDEMETYANGCMEHQDDYVNYNGWNTSYQTQYGVVTFQVRYQGFGSQSNEKGFYYSPDGQPKDFGCILGQEQREQQILFLGEGDNYVLTEQIAPNWFWYEQHW